MDFDDLDAPTEAPVKPSRFAPKSKKQPAAKQEPKPKDEPKQEVPVVVVKEEEEPVKMDVEEPMAEAVSVEMKEEEKEVPSALRTNGEGVMEEGCQLEEEDDVVAEYDVYNTPCVPDTQLYVMQYPLRPSWRPYELEQRCTEVRLKPNSMEVEVDLSIDVDSDNYDSKSPLAEKMRKQTLSSSWKPPQASGYAVGLLMGKKLYLNPIHAVVQLRPSMEYLDFSDAKKNINPNTPVKEEGTSIKAPAGQSRKQNKQRDPEVVELWTPHKYYGSTTDLAERHRRKMVTDHDNRLQFSMNPHDYLNSLCPGGVINKMKSNGPSRSSLLSLPLEERLMTLLVEGPPVQRFNVIKHFAPNHPVEDVLHILQQHAYLIQGLWVAKPNIRHPKQQGAEPLARDYALLLFSRSPVIKDSDLDVLGSQKSVGRTVLREIAVERPYCKDWKFKEPTDVSFMKLYPDVVDHQWKLMQDIEKRLQERFSRRTAGLSVKRPGPSMRSDEGVARPTNGARSVSTSMSRETQEALPRVLKRLFQTHKVCNVQTIRQGLRDMALSMSAHPKADARAYAIVAAVKSLGDAPPEEIQAVLNEVAVDVHGVYVPKSSAEYPDLNPLRSVVLDLFLGKGPNAKLKKGEIIEAAKIKLQKEPSSHEFQKVITEFCVSNGGAWVVKNGDGVPK